MNKHLSKKALCTFLALVFVLAFSVCASAATEKNAISKRTTEIASVNVTDNDTHILYGGFDAGYIPVISPVLNQDGTYCVCVNENDTTLHIYELDKSNNVSKALSIQQQLDEFSAFTKDASGNYYVLYGAILDTDRNATALRVVQYNAEGVEVRRHDIKGNVSGTLNGIKQLAAGNGALSVNGKYLTGNVGRMMFPDKDGVNHQASYCFALNLSDFTQIVVPDSTVIPYSSHSFHQMIVNDGADFVYVDRGDAYPRAFRITKMSGSNWSKVAEADSFKFKGSFGENDTYSQLGGLVPSNGKYMLVGTYQNTISSTAQSSANLFVQMFNKSNLAAEGEKYLTNYKEIADNSTSFTTVINPKAVRVSEKRVAIPYMVCSKNIGRQEIHVAFVNNNGVLLADEVVGGNESGAVLPRFGVVLYNGTTDTIDWFSISNGKLVINSLPDDDSTEPTGEEPTDNNDDNGGSGDSGDNGNNDNPTDPQPSFFIRVLRFLAHIFLWFLYI